MNETESVHIDTEEEEQLVYAGGRGNAPRWVVAAGGSAYTDLSGEVEGSAALLFAGRAGAAGGALPFPPFAGGPGVLCSTERATGQTEGARPEHSFL